MARPTRGVIVSLRDGALRGHFCRLAGGALGPFLARQERPRAAYPAKRVAAPPAPNACSPCGRTGCGPGATAGSVYPLFRIRLRRIRRGTGVCGLGVLRVVTPDRQSRRRRGSCQTVVKPRDIHAACPQFLFALRSTGLGSRLSCGVCVTSLPDPPHADPSGYGGLWIGCPACRDAGSTIAPTARLMPDRGETTGYSRGLPQTPVRPAVEQVVVPVLLRGPCYLSSGSASRRSVGEREFVDWVSCVSRRRRGSCQTVVKPRGTHAAWPQRLFALRSNRLWSRFFCGVRVTALPDPPHADPSGYGGLWIGCPACRDAGSTIAPTARLMPDRGETTGYPRGMPPTPVRPAVDQVGVAPQLRGPCYRSSGSAPGASVRGRVGSVTLQAIAAGIRFRRFGRKTPAPGTTSDNGPFPGWGKAR
jgi:hypothetical protein